MPQTVGRVLRRWELGNALRRLREERGMTIVDVTVAMKERYGSSFSAAKLSRMETAKRGVIPRDVHDLCGIYGVTDDVRDHLLELAKLAREQEEWEEQVAQPGLVRYTALEQIALRTRLFSMVYVPGLLQTNAYASAVEGLESLAPDYYDWIHNPGEPGARTEFRLRRQLRLEGTNPLDLHAVLDENVFRRMLADPKIMPEQLQHLINMSEMPNIIVQIIPISRGLYPGSESNYWTILDLPEEVEQLQSCAYVDMPLGATLMEREADIARLSAVFDVVTQLAMSPQESQKFMEDLYMEISQNVDL